MPEKPENLVIAGGGLVGITAALLFSRYFEKVDLFEKRADPMLAEGKDARSLQLVLSARGWNTFRLLGIENEIRSKTLALRGRWHHRENEKFFEAYSPEGECISCVSRESLYRLLCEKAKQNPGIRLHFQTEVSDVDFENQHLWVKGHPDKFQKKIPYDFLIGADGVRSRIASGLNPEGEDFRKEIHVYREISVDGVPWEKDAFHYWHTQSAMIGAFPVFEGGFSLFLVHREEDVSDLLEDKQSGKFKQLFPEIESQIPDLKKRFAAAKGGVLGSKSCRNWHFKETVALAGDAAHAVLPFMGQGLNTGLEDLWFLNNYLSDTGKEKGKSLRNYERERQPQADAIRQISEDQFRYLTGKYQSEEYRMRKAIADTLAANGQLPTYSACAFSLEPFSVILEREEELRRKLST